MKHTLAQLVIAMAAIGIVGCGSENGGTIVTPTGQTISTSPSTQSPTPITANKPQPSTTTPAPSSGAATANTSASSQGSTTTSTSTSSQTSPQPVPTTNNYKDAVAILEASGGFMKYGNVTMMDFDEAADGTVTVVFKITNDLASGDATFTTEYIYILSADGKTATMKPIHNKIEANNFKYNSKCLGEVTLSGKVESEGWQVTHTDTKLYDFEHIYNTTNSPSTVMSLSMAGGPHSVKLNNAKMSVKDKKADDTSTMQFGTGFIYDGKEVNMVSQLQDAINANCFNTK